ncbi:MAG: L-seryl-tRNA(Sec) selenium transferase [Acidobacteriota bacterium]|nr:L-seryl-tRNA(Sec) selenium transferase [Acidobacteriota bacterium]
MFRRIPSVDELLRHDAVQALSGAYGRASVTEAARVVLSDLRAAIARGEVDDAGLEGARDGLAAALCNKLEQDAQCSLRRVINATGVLIHTNLGRSPLSPKVVQHIAEITTGYSNLEFDLEKGERGSRNQHAQNLFERLFARHGIQEARTAVVNNNAAAVMLALAALAEGGEVIVSRGELVEIGGSFRIPDIMARSGAILHEVGTTNRTRVGDYEQAINERTKLLLRVHRSNFEIVGFTERPELSELVELGRRKGIPVMEDLGSGALVDLLELGIRDEPNVYDSLHAGVALVTYSGDKLLGGPQAGLLSGEPALVQKIAKHPLFRALRADKLCYAALEATLLSYLREEYDEIPLLRMMRTPLAEVRRRCEALAAVVPEFAAELLPTEAMIGGGAAAGKSLPSFAVALLPGADGANALARRLRELAVPVIARVEQDRVLLDLRTVPPEEDAYLAQVLRGLTL